VTSVPRPMRSTRLPGAVKEKVGDASDKVKHAVDKD
jgi:uncharacterized protein YjbJ (UPF0337 family)